MNILFLDIDGVLTHHKHIQNGGTWYNSDLECLKNLEYIIKETNCKIIISASIRKSKTLDQICKYYNIDRKIVIDKTPGSSTGKRGEEIKKWLDTNRNLDIESIVILDDSNDIDPLKDFWVHINGKMKRGMNKEEAMSAVVMLKSNNYKELK